MNTLQKIVRAPFLALIWLYQHTLSFDHGPLRVFFPYGYCQYTPSCSQYTYEAFDKHGVIKGFILGMWRIIRCNPWSKGGEDAVPNIFSLPKFERRK